MPGRLTGGPAGGNGTEVPQALSVRGNPTRVERPAVGGVG
jgi:hypothetical protein